MGESFSSFHPEAWQPLAWFGITSPFFAFNSETLINTWCALGVLLVIAVLARIALRKPDSLPGYLVLTALRSLMNMITQSLGYFHAAYFYFVGALFVFIVICNALVVIPGLEEPTKSLNTTLACGLIAVLYAQFEGVRSHGIIGYLNEFFKTPLTLLPNRKLKLLDIPVIFLKVIVNCIAGLLTFPMELLGKTANIISLSLRLFGNIFGGSVIGSLFKLAISGSWIRQTLALVTGINLIIVLFFGLFEAFIQAFVFSILSITYITMAVQKGDEHGV